MHMVHVEIIDEYRVCTYIFIVCVLLKYVRVCMHFIHIISKYRKCCKMVDVYSYILFRKGSK